MINKTGNISKINIPIGYTGVNMKSLADRNWYVQPKYYQYNDSYTNVTHK